MTPPAAAHVGQHLRRWRQQRRLSQLELAHDARVSARHLSYLETGRSAPGRATLLRLLRALEVPPREQNRILLAAGHAPTFQERPLDHPDLQAARTAIDLVLERHEPFPAVAFDRHWNLIAANRGMTSLAAGLTIAPELLQAPVNVVRVGLHPRGLAPLIRNLPAWRAQIRQRLLRQAHDTHEPELHQLIDELDAYATSDPGFDAAAAGPAPGPALGPLHLQTADGTRLSFIGMLAAFDSPFDVTAAEIAIELLFPADPETAEAIHRHLN